jgi:hypothetical protein
MISAVLVFISALALPTALARHSAEGAAAAPQAAPPSLPRLAFDSFPAPTRDVLARAYKDAAARPNDAETVGALARLLHAWEQWEAAHEVYFRAQVLAPRTFAWHYLDADCPAAPRPAHRGVGAARAGTDDLAGRCAGASEAGRGASRSGESRAEPAAVRGVKRCSGIGARGRARTGAHRGGGRAP